MHNLHPSVAEGLTGWQKVCLSRAAACLRNSAAGANVIEFYQPSQRVARQRAHRWLEAALKEDVHVQGTR